MHIWMDADACPKAIKEILYRVVERLQIPMTMVANSKMQTPNSPLVQMIVVAAGADVADREIVERMDAGDLVITADIPLAADVIEKRGHALNPRGTFYSEANVKQYLTMRNFMDDLRGSGVMTGGPAAFSNSDRMAFANQLDRFLTRHIKMTNNDRT
ncbi:MAG: YaiI/YqxD family protein [Mariprofundaceae bacterium]